MQAACNIYLNLFEMFNMGGSFTQQDHRSCICMQGDAIGNFAQTLEFVQGAATNTFPTIVATIAAEIR